MQMTLVAYYGNKPAVIEDLIRPFQEALLAQLGYAYEPYSIEQVHATIIGLEAVRDGSEVININFRELREERRPMNLVRVLEFLRATKLLPFNVQIGGFSPAMAYPFTSRADHPYFRSFSLQGPTAVAMGWPIRGQSYPRQLDALRKCFNDCNVLHKYHRSSGDIDNDFFFVLGRVERSLLTECQIQETQDALREILSNREAVSVPVRREDLSLALYEDPLLSPKTTRSILLDDAEAELSKIIRSYPTAGT